MYIPEKIGALPFPQYDECLSSFLLRAARRHGMLPHSFCRVLWPEYEFWTRDIDRCARTSLIAAISRRTGLTDIQVEQLTLRPLMQALGGQVRRHGIGRWILPIGIYHRIRHAYGQRYCPDCLAESPRYLRRAWRLGYASICDRHGRPLHDACPQCDAPFIPHRHDSLMMAQCCDCGGNLILAPVLRGDAHAEALQAHLAGLGAVQACSSKFHGWHTLLSILARYDQRFEQVQGGWFIWRQSDRIRLLSCAFLLYQDWPRSFVEWAAAHRLSQATMADFAYQDTWLKEAIHLIPERYMPHRNRRQKKQGVHRFCSQHRKKSSTNKLTSARKMLDSAYRILKARRRAEATSS